MLISQELRTFVEALGIGMWCKGAGQPLEKGEIGQAQRALEDDLAGPKQELQAIAGAIVAATIMTTLNELRHRGLADVNPAVLADLIERLTISVINEVQIEVVVDDEADE